jgi:hypothetical protein
MGFFETYCWECHGAGDPLRDYTLLSAVMAESVSIRCGVTPNALSDCTGFPPPAQFPIEFGTHAAGAVDRGRHALSLGQATTSSMA